MVQTRNSLFRQRCSSLSKSKAFQLFFIINTWFLINLNFNSFHVNVLFSYPSLMQWMFPDQNLDLTFSLTTKNISLWNVENNRYFVMILSLKTWFPSIFFIYISAPSFWTFLQCKTKSKNTEKMTQCKGH